MQSNEEPPVNSDWPDGKWLMDAITESGSGNQDALNQYARGSPNRCLSDDGTWFVMTRRHSAHLNGAVIMDVNAPGKEGKLSVPCINMWRWVSHKTGGFPSWSKAPMHSDCEFTSVSWADGKFHFEFKCLTSELAQRIGDVRRFSLTKADLTRLAIMNIDSWQSKTAESLAALLKELVDEQAYTKTPLPPPPRKPIPKPNPATEPVLHLGEFMFPVKQQEARLFGFISNATDYKLLWMIEVPCDECEVVIDGETEYWRPKIYMQSMRFTIRDWRQLAGQEFRSRPDDDDQPAIYIYTHEDLNTSNIRFLSRSSATFDVDWTFSLSSGFTSLRCGGNVQTPVNFTDVTVWLDKVDTVSKAKERLERDLDLCFFHEPEMLLHPNAGPRFKFRPRTEI